MRLEIRNVRAEGGRIRADLVAAEHGLSIETSCWADLAQQWPADLVRKFLVKEAVQAARAKLAQSLVTAKPEDAAKLRAFGALMEAQVPVRVNSFYDAAIAHYAGAAHAQRRAALEAEKAAWNAAQVNAAAIAGEV